MEDATALELGPSWEPDPETPAPGTVRYWLRSRRYGIASTEDGYWCVVGRDGQPTHGDLIEDIEDARRLAERSDAQDRPPQEA